MWGFFFVGFNFFSSSELFGEYKNVRISRPSFRNCILSFFRSDCNLLPTTIMTLLSKYDSCCLALSFFTDLAFVPMQKCSLKRIGFFYHFWVFFRSISFFDFYETSIKRDKHRKFWKHQRYFTKIDKTSSN